MAAQSGNVDPMHQFTVEPLFGHDWAIAGHSIAFTNSAAWMAATLVALWLFMLGGMKRELVPGRWQMAVEGFTGFITNMMDTSIGPKGRRFVPYVFSLFMFILFANILGMLPTALFGLHPFTVTSHLTATGVLAILSFLGTVFIPIQDHTSLLWHIAQWTPMFGVAVITRAPLTGDLPWYAVVNAIGWLAVFVLGAAWRMSKDTARV